MHGEKLCGEANLSGGLKGGVGEEKGRQIAARVFRVPVKRAQRYADQYCGEADRFRRPRVKGEKLVEGSSVPLCRMLRRTESTSAVKQTF